MQRTLPAYVRTHNRYSSELALTVQDVEDEPEHRAAAGRGDAVQGQVPGDAAQTLRQRRPPHSLVPGQVRLRDDTAWN